MRLQTSEIQGKQIIIEGEQLVFKSCRLYKICLTCYYYCHIGHKNSITYKQTDGRKFSEDKDKLALLHKYSLTLGVTSSFLII